jgi:phosphoribosylanthranilate isomerase
LDLPLTPHRRLGICDPRLPVPTRIKICGITRLADAMVAVEAGVDALGFIFCEASPRFIRFSAAASIVRQLPPFVARVGVFVNADDAAVRRAIEVSGIDTLQFHGDEPPEFCRRFPLNAYKAFRLSDAASLEVCRQYSGMAWLLDSHVPGVPGGTGETFNWDLAIEAKKLNPHILLAGGLTPANVGEAIRRVRPAAVDVSSGVENEPGRKDADKLRAFVAAVRRTR